MRRVIQYLEDLLTLPSRGVLASALANEQQAAMDQFNRADELSGRLNEERNIKDAIGRENVELKGRLRSQSERTMAEWNRAEELAEKLRDAKRIMAGLLDIARVYGRPCATIEKAEAFLDSTTPNKD